MTSEPTDQGPVPALAIVLAVTYNKKELEKLVRICMSTKELSFQESHESSLKALFLNLYYGKSHIDCYHFC